MGYTDKIECPHCHKEIEVEVEIEYGGIDDINAVISPINNKRKGGAKNGTINMEGKHKLRDGSHTSQAVFGYR